MESITFEKGGSCLLWMLGFVMSYGMCHSFTVKHKYVFFKS